MIKNNRSSPLLDFFLKSFTPQEYTSSDYIKNLILDLVDYSHNLLEIEHIMHAILEKVNLIECKCTISDIGEEFDIVEILCNKGYKIIDYYFNNFEYPKAISKLVDLRFTYEGQLLELATVSIFKVVYENQIACINDRLHRLWTLQREQIKAKTYNRQGKQYDSLRHQTLDMYEQPTQILPILCLVSQTRETGKTTFLKWLKMIFSSNMSFLDNQNIGSRFNSDWMGKLLVGVEEASIQDDSLIEILKNISTADRYNSEAKGKDRIEVDMFLKIILCSNKETGLLNIDNHEIRFWVVKVPTIEEKDKDVNLLDKMKVEIPAFLDYLRIRTMHTPEPLSRMWFNPTQLETKALKRMRVASRNKIELELATALYTAMEDLDLEELHLTANDALNIIGKPKASLLEMRGILKDNWKLKTQNNTNSYKKLLIGDFGYHLSTGAKGRYFTVTKLFLVFNFDDLMN